MKKRLLLAIATSYCSLHGATFDWTATTPGAALNVSTNWTPNGIPGNSDTGHFALFSPSTTINPTLTSGTFTPGEFLFTDSTNFTFGISGTSVMVYMGTGVTNSGGGTQTFNVSTPLNLQFENNSSADSTNSGAVVYNVSAGSQIQFQFNSTAGSAIFNASGTNAVVFFNSNSSAENSTLNASNGGSIAFNVNNGANAAVNLTTTGFLDVGFNTPLGSISSDLSGIVYLNGYTLTVGGNNRSTTFAGTMGSGSLVKVGTGTLTFSGTLTGDASVNAGTFALTGNINGNLTTSSGSTVSGTGGHITGDYDQVGGSFFLVNSALPLTVGGGATINGGTVEVANVPLPLNTTFPIITATGGRTGTFDSVVAFNPALSPVLTYDSNDVFLTLTLIFAPSGPMTPNESAVLSGLTGIGSSPSDNALISALASLSENELHEALNQLSGVQYANLIQLSENANRRFLREIFDPYRFIFSDPCACRCNQGIVWTDFRGGQSFLNKDFNAEGFKLYDFGYSLGAYAFVSQWLTLGVAGNYSYDHAKFFQDGTGNGNTFQGAFYALYEQPHWYLFSAVVRGYTFWDIERVLDFDSFFFKPRGKTYLSHVSWYGEVGYNSYFCTLLFQPFLGLEYGHYWRGRIDEKGGDAATLTIASQSKTDLESRLGGRAYACSGPILFSLDADWRHRYTNIGDQIEVAFISFGPTFPILGPKQGKNAIEGSFYAATNICPTAFLYLEASAEAWRRFSAYTLTVGMEKSW